MPRHARLEIPGAVHHVVSRFVNEEFRLTDEVERAEYLARAARAFAATDWCPLAYALMSSHVHWVVVSGQRPSASFVKPLHSGFAGWLNRTQQRLGPVFADRHRTIIVGRERIAELIAYVHNNPVRAGITRNPVESTWTSHRAYVGLVEGMPGLNLARGLALCGFEPTDGGRRSFHDYVNGRAGLPRSHELCATNMRETRARVREALGSAVETSWPAMSFQQQEIVLVMPAGASVRQVWLGRVEDALRVIADRLGVSLGRLSGPERGALSQTRRLILRLWTRHLGRPQAEIRALLGLSSSSAAGLVRSTGLDGDGIDARCEWLATAVRAVE